jgi:hypothetical protein
MMRAMNTRLLTVTLIAVLTVAAHGPARAEPAADPRNCAGLSALPRPDVKVTEVTAVPSATTGAIRVAHCRVGGVIGQVLAAAPVTDRLPRGRTSRDARTAGGRR